MNRKIDVVFVISDQFGEVWGVAPSATQARKQIVWFLPKGLEYTVDYLLYQRVA
jgi:hypothetical protein